MKKFTLLSALLFTALSFLPTKKTYSQLAKGNLLIEGNIGSIGYYKYNTNSETNSVASYSSKTSGFSFNLYPRLGLFLTDKLVVGTELDLYFSRNKGDGFDALGLKSSDNQSTRVSLGLLPFVRYYFLTFKDQKSALYAHVSGGYYGDVLYNSDYNYYNSSSGALQTEYDYNYFKKYNSIYLTAMVGWNKFISDNIALNMNIGYYYNKSNQEYNYTTTNVASGTSTLSPNYSYSNKNMSFNWGLGFTYILNRNK